MLKNSDESAQNFLIEKRFLLICEGTDDAEFLRWFCDKTSSPESDHPLSEDVQLYKLDGKDKLPPFLKLLHNRQQRGHDGRPVHLDSVLIILDGDEHPDRAKQAIMTALKNAGHVVSGEAGEWAKGDPNTAYLVFPSCGKEDLRGAIENLCFQLIDEQTGHKSLLTQARAFIDHAEKLGGETLKHKDKNILHAYFSSTNKFVGKRIGLAATSGAFDIKSEILRPLAELIIRGLL